MAFRSSWWSSVLSLLSISSCPNLQNSSAVVLAVQQISEVDPCRLPGATYGYPKRGSRPDQEERVHKWSPIVGIACADTCYEEGIKWSSVAFEYGDREVESEEECQKLCLVTEGCDTWTYWPSGVGNLDIELNRCDFCDGAEIFRDESYCFDDDCSECGEVYYHVHKENIQFIVIHFKFLLKHVIHGLFTVRIVSLPFCTTF